MDITNTIDNIKHKMIMFLLENYNDNSWFNNNFEYSVNSTDDDKNEIYSNKQYYKDFDFDFIVTNVDREDVIDENYEYLLSNNILSTEPNIISIQSNDMLVDIDDNQETTIERSMKRSLSESTVSDVTTKKFRDDTNNDIIPDYLKINNKCFHFIITKYLNSTISFKDLQSLTVLKHHIAITKQEQILWEFYMILGTGHCETMTANKVNMKDRCFWPSVIRLQASSYIETVNSDDEQRLYELFVHNYLQELDQLIIKYKHDYDMHKSTLTNSLSSETEQILDAFVLYFGIEPIEMKFKYEIALLQYEYELYLLDCIYQQYIPTEYEKKIAERLCFLQYECIQTKMDLLEYKQRIFYNNPSKSLSSVAISTVLAEKNRGYVESDNLLFTNDKHIQKTITDLIIESLNTYERQIYHSHKLLENELNQISINDTNDNKSLRNPLVDIIFKQFKVIQKKLEYITNYRINYTIKSQKETISFAPTVIINTSSHQFTNAQLKLLNRGPNFIPPCQLSTLSTESVSFRDMIEKQYKILQHNFNVIFAQCNMNTARSMFINKTIKDLYMKTFNMTVPREMHERAIYEKRLIQSIKKDLNTNNIIIRRTADQKNMFYVTDRKDFETLANNYLSKADEFELIDIKSSNDNNTDQFIDYLKQMIKSINSEIEKILHNKKVYKQLLDKLIINETKVHLPYLYFLPYVDKVDIVTLKPVIVAQYSATFWLAQFLNELFEPVLQRQSLSTIFDNGVDFIQKLNHYANVRKRFTQNTFFIKLTITNINKITTHTIMLQILERFLRNHLAILGLGNLSIQKLIDLTALYLNHNIFLYNNNIYRVMKGAPSSLSLTNTLSQIYVYEWQNILLDRTSLLGNELFGRCKNQFFFTWNQTTTSDYHKFFADLSEKDINIHYKIETGFEMEFLNINIENRKGILYTNIFHEKSIQKYTLPYVIGNTQVAHSHWLQSALIRAVRYCTSVDDFNSERIYLEVLCLTNGYPLDFIERRINHFYTHFGIKSLLYSVLDQNLYNKLRDRLFNFIRVQKQSELENSQLQKNKRCFELTYLYEYGSKYEFEQQLQKIICDYLNTNLQLARNEQIKIILNTKQQYSLNALLTEEKPRKKLSLSTVIH